MSPPRLTTLVLLAAIALATVLAYLPGVHGPFVFDDWASLPALGANGRIRDLGSFLRYVTSGTADPTGRPIALASFAMNAQDWPANPLPFKLTNVAIHSANAVLLAVLLTLLSKAAGLRTNRVAPIAWLAAALWALHPFLVSTVLYVVQREAILATSFALLALIAWLRAREAFAAQRPSATYWLYAGAGGASLIALLCKANGVVIPLLALAIEATLPPMKGGGARLYRRHIFLTLMLPSLLLIGALAWLALSSIGQPPLPVRGWTVGERLLTEPAILLDYLSRLWLIQSAGGAFFHDQLTVYSSLLTPWYATLPLLCCLLMIGAAVALRRRAPLMAAATLFFFAGHVLESTSVPLELYFEHRNYLPSALMFWPLAMGVMTSPFAWLRRTLPIVLLCGVFWLTRSQATLWSDPVRQALVWAKLQPDSPRAQTYAAGIEATSGDLAAARRRIDVARRQFAGEPQIAMNLLDIHCATGGVSPNDLAYAQQTLEQAPRDPGALMTHWFEKTIARSSHPACRGLDMAALRLLLAAAARNPRVASLPGRRQDIAYLWGNLALVEGDVTTAASDFARALLEEPTRKVALSEAALLGTAGRPDLGLKLLDLMDSLPPEPSPSVRYGMAWVHDRVLRAQDYWPQEVADLRARLDEAAARNAPQASDP